MEQQQTNLQAQVTRIDAAVRKIASRLADIEDAILSDDDIRSLEQADRDLAEGKTVSHEEVGTILREE